MMKRILSFLILIGSFAAGASERREFYNSIRSLGMGGTAVASANDETSLLLNPAGLGKLRDYYGTILDPELDIGGKTLQIYGNKSFSAPWSLKDVMPSVVASPGEYFHFRGQIFPSFVAKNFGIGLIQKYNVNAIYDSTTARAETFFRDDVGLVLGYNLRLFDGRIKIGVAGRLINRIEVDEPALDPTQPLDMPTLAAAGIAKEGTGFGIDTGILLAAPWTWLPTIGATLRDMGGTNFNLTSGQRLSQATTRPNVVPQDLDVGIALFPIHRKNVRSVWTIEYKGVLTAQNETDKAKLMHAGIELNIGDLVFLRMGYNQRYFTGGFELASEHFQFQLATYGEEIGTVTAPREDRRYVGKAAFRF